MPSGPEAEVPSPSTQPAPAAAPRPRSRTDRTQRLLVALTAFGIAAVTFAVYSRAFGHGFVNWDDWQYVQDNPALLGRNWAELLRGVFSLNYHPLTMLSMALNVAVPLTARPFLVTNADLHAIDTLLVFVLAWMLSGRRWRVAAFASACFGLHPVHVESVAWVSERKDVLHAGFYLGAAIAYVRHLERGGRRALALAFGLFVLACLAKGMAVSLPLVLVLIHLWLRRPLLTRNALLALAPFFAVALLFGLVAVDVQSGGNFHGLLHAAPVRSAALVSGAARPAFERLVIPSYGFVRYAAWFFVPLGLCAFHPYPPPAALHGAAFALAPLAFAALLAFAAWDLRRSRIAAFGIGWYLATILLVLQWLPVGAAIVAERYAYLPYIGLAFACGMALDRVFDRVRAAGLALWAAGACVLVVFAALTLRQIDTWKDSDALWSRVLEVHPGTAIAYEWRGNARHVAGRLPEAVGDLRTARALGDRRPELFEDLGTAFAAAGRMDSALVTLGEAIAAAPQRASARLNRAAAWEALGRMSEAEADLDTALAFAPGEADEILGRRATVRLRIGNVAGAVADCDRAIAAGTRRPTPFIVRAIARMQLGDRPGAVRDLREALRLDPGNRGLRAQLAALGQAP